MSIAVSKYIWKHSEQMGPYRMMLLALAEHADEYGLCWPSINTLAGYCVVSDRQAKRLVKKLVADDAVKITIGGGRGRSNRYQIVYDDELMEVIKGDIQGIKGDIQGIKGDTGDTVYDWRKGDIQGERVTSRAIKGDMGDTRSTIEPPIEPLYKQNGRKTMHNQEMPGPNHEAEIKEEIRIQEMMGYLAAAVKETCVPGSNEERFRQVAGTFLANGVAHKDIQDFQEWWDKQDRSQSYFYEGLPALTSLHNNIKQSILDRKEAKSERVGGRY